MVITVLQDLLSKECHLTDFEIDKERVVACGYAIIGQLPEDAPVALSTPEDDHHTGPLFTSCTTPRCPLWLMLDNDDAPEHCAGHSDEVDA